MHLTFLGTGASGGTPGRGRGERRESSLLATSGATTVLVDATRDLADQLPDAAGVDAVVLTHGHRDASAGVAVLREVRAGPPPLPVLAHHRTHRVLRGRYRHLDHVELTDVAPEERRRIGAFDVVAVEVPHAHDDRFPTYAWRLEAGADALVYASDVAELTPALERLSRGADLLVLDGAMYGRAMFTHLRIEEAVPVVCGWDVGRILLTQIGRTAPPHEELAGTVHGLCGRAVPAHDGLQVDL